MAAYGYFAGLFGTGTQSNNGLSSIYSSLGDYGTIQRGAYKKLLSAYYKAASDDDSDDDTKTSVKSLVSSADKSEYSKTTKYASALSLASQELLTSQNGDLYDEGKEDKLVSKVKSFVSSYNTVLADAKKKDPNTKLVLFLLSDGQQNQGYNLSDVDGILKEYQIPVYSIAYGGEADMEELKAVSSVNEATVIDADSDDVLYKFTDLSVFHDEGMDGCVFSVCDGDGDCVVFDYDVSSDDFVVLESNSELLCEVLDGLVSDDVLFDCIGFLGVGDYRVIDGLKFLHL